MWNYIWKVELWNLWNFCEKLWILNEKYLKNNWNNENTATSIISDYCHCHLFYDWVTEKLVKNVSKLMKIWKIPFENYEN